MLRASGVKVLLALFYVDDVRLVLEGFKRGLSWSRSERRFIFSPERLEQDNRENIKDEIRVSREVLLAMNSVAEDLTFTMEVMSDFSDNTIPMLDFSLWLETTGSSPCLSYRFFSKPMATRYVILEPSAWAWSSKCASLAQEVQRRMQNTSRDQPLSTTLDILSNFSTKLTRSGYSREQVRQILESGIKGFHSKLRRGLVHRPVTIIQQDREIRRILEKSTWYLPREKSTEESGSTHRLGAQGKFQEGSQLHFSTQPICPQGTPLCAQNPQWGTYRETTPGGGETVRTG